MRQDSQRTRARLIAAAERLFAERGVDAVSMNEVQRAAGQKNRSALQYHFGSKDALIDAILQKHVPGIELRRHAMLDEIEARGDLRPRELIRALAEPLFDKLDDADGGPEYVRLFAQLVGSPRATVLLQGAMRANRGADRLMRLLAVACPEFPEAVRIPRYLHMTELLFHGVADLDRLCKTEPPLFAASARPLLRSNLIDILTAVATAPVSDETARLAEAGKAKS